MGVFAAGQVVLLTFPSSDLSGAKLRPALLLADAGRGDWLACQITSNPYADSRAIELIDGDFAAGGLRRVSYLRPGKVFTANEKLIQGVAGTLEEGKLHRTRQAVATMLLGELEQGLDAPRNA